MQGHARQDWLPQHMVHLSLLQQKRDLSVGLADPHGLMPLTKSQSLNLTRPDEFECQDKAENGLECQRDKELKNEAKIQTLCQTWER